MDDEKERIINTLNQSAVALDYLSTITEQCDLHNPIIQGHCYILKMIAKELEKCAFDLGEEDH